MRFIYYAIRLAVYALIIGAFFGTAAYFYKNERIKLPAFVEHVKEAILPAAPCTQPMTYSIGTFDPRFGISKDDFDHDISLASSVWDDALDRVLFTYDASATPNNPADFTVNLIYDYRQETTSQLQNLDSSIKGDKATYNNLKAKYDSLLGEYNDQKNILQSNLDAYNSHKKAYEDEVAYWNSQGGAPPDVYQKVQTELNALNAESSKLNDQRQSFNELVNSINNTANSLNHLASTLNIRVSKYNTIGSVTGEEFDEGEYVQDSTGRRIDIFQFNNNSQLKRVLEHELGHALGLEHVDDPKAIMYRLNQGSNEKLTSADIAELKRVCKVQ